jgi:hypothetical protein
MSHGLEDLLHAPATDIMDAVLRGFRAQVDVKGKLAELYLSRRLADLQRQGHITHYEWFDKDGVPDFHVYVGELRLLLECKNIRTPRLDRHGKKTNPVVELQKTRNGLDAAGQKTRGYPVDHFDVLGVCLFNQTSAWEFAFIATRHLERRATDAGILTVFQNVPLGQEDVGRLGKPWSFTLETVVAQEVARRGKPRRGRGTSRKR